MIINDFNIVGITALPDKANAPLVIDSKTVLPISFSFQRFKMIGGRDTQRSESRCGIQHLQLDCGNPLNGLGQPQREPAMK